MQPSCKTKEDLKNFIRGIPDYPKPGILFYDITTLLKEAEPMRFAIDALAQHYANHKIDHVVGVEARGFIFAIAVAYILKAGFVPVRKPQKLPAPTLSASYDLEYGQDSLEIHKDAIRPGDKILVMDDLLATGGTAGAVTNLVHALGGEIIGLGFLMELTFLGGRQKLADYEVFSLLQYDQ